MRYFPVLAVVVMLTMVACRGSANEPPVADAGTPPTAFGGYPVQLDGTGSSDEDGDELTYAWRMLAKPEGSQAVLSGEATASPSFTPDVLGEFVVSLAVNDGESPSLPDYVTVLARPWFTDATEEAGVGGHAMTWEAVRNFAAPPGGMFEGIQNGGRGGVSWADYDNDGDWDLYSTHVHGNLLYRNNGDGTFTDVAEDAGVDVKGWNGWYMKGGSQWGDYDGDGDQDLYVLKRNMGSLLFRNNGDGTFTDVAEEAGVQTVKKASGSAWGDYDADGDLDLAVACKWGVDYLFRNNGDGTFINVAPELDVAQHLLKKSVAVELEGKGQPAQSGSSFQPFWFDYDNNNTLDLFFAVDRGSNYLYKNNGDGTFTEVTETSGIFLVGQGMGVDAGDYDRDGDLDFYVTNWGTMAWGGIGMGLTPNFFFRNNGDGTFSEVSAATGTRGRSGVGWGVSFFDPDNDGDVDLALVNGHNRVASRWEIETRNIDLFYQNNGDGTFTDVTEISGFGLTCQAQGLGTADYDGDGDQDLFTDCLDDRDHLFRNDLANYLGDTWLKVRLRGTESNHFGIGAVVKVTSGGMTQMEQLFAGGSTYSQDAQELHFGLAGETVADKVEVRWPSGIIQTVENVGANRTITITESGSQ
ncbi:MAG: FG-GAP-like repeat-containing protein [SAR202 cluster bacterium]|nr:FG-GAP-like repeat-containing protein [SAR202 cluster bacterium]